MSVVFELNEVLFEKSSGVWNEGKLLGIESTIEVVRESFDSTFTSKGREVRNWGTKGMRLS